MLTSILCFTNNVKKLIDLCVVLVRKLFAVDVQLRLILLLVLTFAGTQLCTLRAEAIAFASWSAFSLSAAFCQLLTRLSNGWKACPENLPDLTIFLPAPVGRVFSLYFAHCCLAACAGSLEGRPFHMLNKGCACLWNGIIRPLLVQKRPFFSLG